MTILHVLTVRLLWLDRPSLAGAVETNPEAGDISLKHNRKLITYLHLMNLIRHTPNYYSQQY